MRIRDSYRRAGRPFAGLEERPGIRSFNPVPQIAHMKEELLARGARGALMSGSGPVIFGLFSTRKEAERTEKAVALPAGWKTVITRGI